MIEDLYDTLRKDGYESSEKSNGSSKILGSYLYAVVAKIIQDVEEKIIIKIDW